MITELDNPKITELFRNFNILTGIRICLFDIRFNELLAYPELQPDYCLDIRKDAEGRRKCRQCDIAALTTVQRTHRVHIYACHAGFTEAVCPITHEGETLGYLVLGHMKNGTPEQIKAAAKIMESCASYIYLSRLIKLNENTLEKRVGAHLAAHLSGELTISSLCRKFNISRVGLYAFFKQVYGRSPAAHIRALRLQYACKLLKTTDKKIACIASDAGFENYTYFAKQFKKEFAVAPGKYRTEQLR